MNKIVFLNIFIQKISNMPLIVYFSYLFTFNTVLEKYQGQ